ncbi:intramembrane metalloprotease PrsW [Bacillaceae bacterium Marseille-Q3522]|nr:intramembrane metalloprotease PrsW [Bacillaceae bacterium Marseille-Q3522]
MLEIISAGIAPGLALLSYFYLRDQFGTEPLSMVIKLFAAGAFLVFPIMFIQYVLEVENIIQSNILHSFLAAGFLEEFFKWFIFLYMAFHHAQFDEPYDGIVYSISISLGFATAENILYLFANGLEHAIGRAFLPVSSHALFGVIMGYYFGKEKFTPESNRKFYFLALIVPIFLHGIYDYILISQRYWLIMILPFMVFLWWFGLRKAKKAHILSKKHRDKSLDTSI